MALSPATGGSRRILITAKDVLCVPATSTPSERSFSVAGRTTENRRTRLSADTVDYLMFLHGLQQRHALRCVLCTPIICCKGNVRLFVTVVWREMRELMRVRGGEGTVSEGEGRVREEKLPRGNGEGNKIVMMVE